MSLPDQDPPSPQSQDLPLITVEPIEEPKSAEPAPTELDILEQELVAAEVSVVPEPVPDRALNPSSGAFCSL